MDNTYTPPHFTSQPSKSEIRALMKKYVTCYGIDGDLWKVGITLRRLMRIRYHPYSKFEQLTHNNILFSTNDRKLGLKIEIEARSILEEMNIGYRLHRDNTMGARCKRNDEESVIYMTKAKPKEMLCILCYGKYYDNDQRLQHVKSEHSINYADWHLAVKELKTCPKDEEVLMAIEKYESFIKWAHGGELIEMRICIIMKVLFVF